MKYMFLNYLDEKAWADLGEAEQERIMRQCEPYVRKMVAEGKFLGGAPLHPTSVATTIRRKCGKHLVTDGPFAETREQLGGYTLIEASNLDEAIEIASAFLGRDSPATIEVRPIVELDWAPSH